MNADEMNEFKRAPHASPEKDAYHPPNRNLNGVKP